MKKRFERIYVEIGNVCNLSCSFCPKTKRKARIMSADEFSTVCERIRGYSDYLFLHVMGEPLLHPELDKILDYAESAGFRLCITTNGTLLNTKKDLLFSHAHTIRKISISLHSAEANGNTDAAGNYLDSVVSFANEAAEHGIFNVMRLWNLDSAEGAGANSENGQIEAKLHNYYPEKWIPRREGFRLRDHVFIEYAGRFTWPTESKADATEAGFCHGLTDQIAILAAGEVVPCCLDCNAEILLGNIFEDSLEDILATERAKKMKSALECRKFTEPLCQKCTYARRF